MAKVAIGFGVALIVLGLVSFYGTGAAHGTALIPAYFGGALVVCGLVALNERAMKHAMHAASVLGLVGAVAPLVRMVRPLMGYPMDVPAFVSQLLMVVLCGVFLALCVRRFIVASRERRAAAAAGGA